MSLKENLDEANALQVLKDDIKTHELYPALEILLGMCDIQIRKLMDELTD